MVPRFFILLEITLAFFVQLIVASPVSLGKRSTFKVAGAALHNFNLTDSMYQQSMRLFWQICNSFRNSRPQHIARLTTTMLLVASK